MHALMDLIRDSGIWGLLVIGLGVLGTFLSMVLAVAALLVRKKSVSVGVLGFCLLVLVGVVGIATLGWMMGTSEVELALANVSPDQRAAMEAYGRSAALGPLKLAVPFVILSLFSMIGAGVSLGLTKPPQGAA